MSTKKKSPTKPSGPAPLLKLKFDKFPDKQVGVYFEPAKRCFYADFGFEQYESPSVAGLEQKIKAAIKAGVTPSPVWAPMIRLSVDTDPGRNNYKQALDFKFGIDLERQYYCIGKGGKLMDCDWETPERTRTAHARESYGTFAQSKLKALNAPVYKRDTKWNGGVGVDALVPYTDDLWKQLQELRGLLRSDASGLILRILSGATLKPLLELFIGRETDARKPAAKKPALRPPAPKVKPMPNRERRTDRELKPAASADSKQPLLPLHDGAQRPIVIGKLSDPRVGSAPDFHWLDMVIDLPPGNVPAEMIAAAGFPEGSTAEKHKDGDFMVRIPKQPGDLDTTVGTVKHVRRDEMQKLIRDRINGQRGAKPAHEKKISIRGAASTGVRTKPAAQKKKANGDNTAREHLVVKYQGNQLTLGHGPLGNYLVEALRKTYPLILSAYCLKNNSVQISLQGVSDPFTITGADFERLINHPEPPSQSGNMYGRQALQNLRKLADDIQPEDPPAVIPSLILAAAGYSASASAEIGFTGSGSDLEIILRMPKKAPQFMSMKQLEQRIQERIPAEPAQKAAVNA